MYKIRKILTITSLVISIIILQGCSNEIKAKELALLEGLTDKDIQASMNSELDGLISNYKFINMDDLKIVHDLTETRDRKYQLVVELNINEDMEYSRDKIDNLSNIIASVVNKTEPVNEKISNVNINWTRDLKDQEAVMHYSYKLDSYNPEILNKYVEARFE